ncbi:MAG: glutamate mutase L, partial [Anaerolineae bacterium]
MGLESFVTADLGSVTTRVTLIDQVAGEYRLVAHASAPTTLSPPWEDVSLGFLEAIGKMETVAGRRLLAEGRLITPERGDGSGVDGFVATTSAMEPLRLVVAGMMEPWSLRSALHAAHSTYTLVEGTFTVDELCLSSAEEMLDFLRLLREGGLDAILIAGGIEGGPTLPLVEMAKDLALLCASGEMRPRLIFAGNEEARVPVAEVLEGVVDLEVVSNLLPRLGDESLTGAQDLLENLVGGKIALIPGIESVERWSLAPIQATARALGWAIRYLAQEYELKVLGVDIGGGSVGLFSARDDRYFCALTSDVGSGYGLDRFLAERGVERILRWLPFDLEGAGDRILNKAFRPGTFPQRREDLYLEQAVARELMRWALERSGERALVPVDLIVGAGGFFSHLADPRQAALILLDGLQPRGVCSLALDEFSLLPQFGALAMVEPLAAAQVLARDALLKLGTVIAPLGVAREGEVALRFKVVFAEGGAIEGEVPYGSLEVIPLLPGQRA